MTWKEWKATDESEKILVKTWYILRYRIKRTTSTWYQSIGMKGKSDGDILTIIWHFIYASVHWLRHSLFVVPVFPKPIEFNRSERVCVCALVCVCVLYTYCAIIVVVDIGRSISISCNFQGNFCSPHFFICNMFVVAMLEIWNIPWHFFSSYASYLCQRKSSSKSKCMKQDWQ